MKNQNNILDDIESDINGDWINIQKSIQASIKEEKEKEKEKEIKEEIKNPNRIYFPNFKEFYEVIIRIYENISYGCDLNYLRSMLGEILRRSSEKMPTSFHKIWEMFCNPSEYRYTTVKCNRCGDVFDILFKEDYHRVLYTGEIGTDNSYATIKTKIIYCYSCGERIAHFNECSVMGIYKHFHVDKRKYEINYMEERSNGFK